MKYYVYVSDSKLDMLYPQIPKGLKDKIAAELKIDLKILSASLKQKESEETRYSKLRLVSDYIEKSESVGTIENPGAYFRGALAMRWGPFGPEKEQIVFFAGSVDRTGGARWSTKSCDWKNRGVTNHCLLSQLLPFGSPL